MDCRPPGSSVHGILQARALEQVATPPPGDPLSTQGWSPALLRCRRTLYHLNRQGRPRMLEQVATSSSRASPRPRDQTCISVSPASAGRFFTTSATWEAPIKLLKVKLLVAQSYLTLATLMDCSPPGSSVHGILLARVLEWVPISSSRGSSRPRDQTQISCIAGRFFFLPSEELLGKCKLKPQ